jgi:hypothetical protein
MRLIASTAAVLLLLAPAAHAQQAAQLIVGEWHCSAPAGGLVSAGPMIYKADGTSTFDQTVTGKVEGMDLMVRITGNATWAIETNGQLTDRIIDAEAVEGTVDGGPLPESVLTAFADEVIANGLSTSDFTISATRMIISDGQGGGSTCTR